MRRMICLAVLCGGLALLGQGAASAEEEKDPTMARVAAACPGVATFIQNHAPGSESAEDLQPTVATPPKASAAPEDPALRDELLRMAGADQQARFSGDFATAEVRARVAAVDEPNLRRMRTIVATHGFPTVEAVGQDGFDAAWLLVQHADADPAFQESMLDILSARGGLEGEQLALLTDRVLLAQGKSQRYGSQLQKGDDGKWVMRPLQGSRSDVDQRRAGLGMMPLADYECMIGVVYAAAPQTPPTDDSP